MIFQKIIFKLFDDNLKDYFVSKCGQVLSLMPHRGTKERIMKQRIDHNGYVTVGCRVEKKQKHLRVHRLVAIAWVDVPEKYKGLHFNELQVDHIDGNRQHNHAENLQWISRTDHGQKTKQSTAFKAGQLSCAKNLGKPVKVINLSTDKEQLFPSSGAAARAYKRTLSTFVTANLPREFTFNGEKFIAEQVPQIERLPNELWKPIPKYIANALLNGADCTDVMISNLGRKKNKYGKIQDLFSDQSTKYIRVGIGGKPLLFHRVVAAAFFPNQARMMLNDDLLMAKIQAGKETIVVHHKNNDPTDCRASNLEWVTGTENNQPHNKKRRKFS